LSNHMELIVMDFMVRNPLYAEPWQPVGFIRQQMLANSYSCLPVLGNDECWCIVSDTEIATFLGPERTGKIRTKLMAKTLQEAFAPLKRAKFVDEKTPLAEALELLKHEPILLVQNPGGNGLLGILTAFDLL
jgi:predicted transcriptional regulator